MAITRRQAIQMAASLGATLAWPSLLARAAKTVRTERRDLYPQGVASGDPQPDSVLLWTRRPPAADGQGGSAKTLRIEVATDPDFHHVVSRAEAALSPEADWTCRVLAAGLKPRQVYWYRFTDEHGFGSRVGRTLTAPAAGDGAPVRFAFVSCQNVTQGACNAYRRMIFEDEKQPADQRLGFVLHLGDFVYEVVWYPEDRKQGMYDRRLRDIVRYPQGEKISDFHIPVTVEDYRALYRGYLTDPDLQDARARWPFVCMWDNHEFSWKGWQSQQNFGGNVRSAQTRKVAANQAWFEYQPARVAQPGHPGLDRFVPPAVADTPVRDFDEHGLGTESGNRAAIDSLKVFRTLRWGKHVDLILTDNRSFRSEPVADQATTAAFQARLFPNFIAQDVLEILDAGRAYAGGQPPETIRWNGADVPNPRRAAPPSSMLGAEQKKWFLDRLRTSAATWKLWGNSVGMLDWRADLQNLPAEAGPRWPSGSYGLLGGDDWTGYRTERAEILDFIAREKITGFATVVGDRHSFLAGLLAKSLPPQPYAPVGAEFITGSISAPTLFEGAKYNLPKELPARAVYLHDKPGGGMEPAINLTLRHGVRASLALHQTGDRQKALAASNPEVAPHLAHVDLGGHGYAVVKAGNDDLEVEFVCLPPPLERSDRSDGGPLAYRIAHRVKRWAAGTAPRLERTVVEGELPLGA
jgi:alkaline phosphatase D